MGEGGGGSVILNIFIQNLVKAIRLGSCNIEKHHFDLERRVFSAWKEKKIFFIRICDCLV